MADLQIYFKHVPTGQTVRFTAFIESFADAYSAEWSSEKVFGRMDPIAQYKGTGRVMTFNFTVPAASEDEATLNHRKISKLINFMYPTYEANTNIRTYVITAPPLMMVRFNNLIRNQEFATPPSNPAAATPQPPAADQGLLGYIPEIKYEPNMESNIFTIEAANVNNKNLLAFQSFKVGITLNVLHTHRLGWAVVAPSVDEAAGISKPGSIGPSQQRFPFGFDILNGT